MTYRDPKTGRWAEKPGPTHYVVFVYGTLKHGYGNAYVLGPGAEFLGKATTCPHYRMVDIGCPVIMDDPDGHPVAGELYRIEARALPGLDRLENEGRMYDRKVIECTLKNGGPVSCSIYVGCEYWSKRGIPCILPNEDGELEWTRPEVEARLDRDDHYREVRSPALGEQHD